MHSLAAWTARRWVVAAAAAVAITLAIGVPTDVVPNPIFGRPTTPVTWWSYPVLAATAALGGMLVATYVRSPAATDELDRPGRTGGIGGMLSFFAVGCPTCNKLVVLAIGSSGALDWFAPAQPILAGASLVLLGWALGARLRNDATCRIAVPATTGDIMAR